MLNSLFQVNGKPYFSIGGQVNNSSAYDTEDYRYALDAAAEMGLNTIAAPVYWETLEPVCGEYDFTQTEMILSETEKRGLKLVILWFGSWKNGTSRYVPAWMKRETETYRPCFRKAGTQTAILSPWCEATMQKDAAAFRALAEYVEKRNASGTVLALQVENEPGFLGTPRDYAPEVNELFAAPVPKEVSDWAKALTAGEAYEAYTAAGRKEGADWKATFGFHAEELFSAYRVAGYIDYVAACGREVSSLPMYVNVWTREHQFRIPGLDYPSGGATTLTLDLWKKMTPHIDCISPDLYYGSYATYMQLCETYHRPDNILYIPESHAGGTNGRYVMTALEKYELSSIHCFAIDSVHSGDGKLLTGAKEYKDTVTILSNMKPLIEAYQGTGKLHAVAQYDGMGEQFIDFGDYLGRVVFFDSLSEEPYLHLDSHHFEPEYMGSKGVGLIVYEGNGVFYLAGRSFKLALLKKTCVDDLTDLIWAYQQLSMRNIPYVSVDEGQFDENGTFCVSRRRSGDETDTGIWAVPDVGVVRVEMV